MTNTNLSPEIIARHVLESSQLLGKALHYHRFFGQPIAAFSAKHNEARAAINDRTVRALAAQAGEYCAYSGYHCAEAALFGEIAMVALDVKRISEAFCEGYHTTMDTLGIAGEDPMPIDGPERFRALLA